MSPDATSSENGPILAELCSDQCKILKKMPHFDALGGYEVLQKVEHKKHDDTKVAEAPK